MLLNTSLFTQDLASLLKALYDSVGSSIKLPPHGARTLKLRLSVGQDHSANMKNSVNLKANAAKSNSVSNADAAKDKSSKNGKEFSKMNNLTRKQVKCSNEHKVNKIDKALLKPVTLNSDPVSSVPEEGESQSSSLTQSTRLTPVTAVNPATHGNPGTSASMDKASGKPGQENVTKHLRQVEYKLWITLHGNSVIFIK